MWGLSAACHAAVENYVFAQLPPVSLIGTVIRIRNGQPKGLSFSSPNHMGSPTPLEWYGGPIKWSGLADDKRHLVSSVSMNGAMPLLQHTPPHHALEHCLIAVTPSMAHPVTGFLVTETTSIFSTRGRGINNLTSNDFPLSGRGRWGGGYVKCHTWVYWR